MERSRLNQEFASSFVTKDGGKIYYKDRVPVVFSHGLPLYADALEDQLMFLTKGYRGVAHDRLPNC